MEREVEQCRREHEKAQCHIEERCREAEEQDREAEARCQEAEERWWLTEARWRAAHPQGLCPREVSEVLCLGPVYFSSLSSDFAKAW